MIFGVRNNTTMWFYKDFLIKWFAQRPDCHLYLACSREIADLEAVDNITFTKGYL